MKINKCSFSDIEIKQFGMVLKKFYKTTDKGVPIKFGMIISFEEKPSGDGSWINGGYFVLEPGIFDYVENDQTVWERQPLETLAKDSQLSVYRHNGYWNAVDTLRDKNRMQDLWDNKQAPWKIW